MPTLRAAIYECRSNDRLVTDSLEDDWTERLRVLEALQQENERLQRADHKLLSSDARTQIRALAEDFPRVWNDHLVVPVERKRMIDLPI